MAASGTDSQPQLTRASRWGRPVAGTVLCIAIVAGIAAAVGIALSPWIPAGLGLLLLLSITLGVTWQGSGVFTRPIMAVRTPRKELALTFDDGPDPRFTPALLDLLDARGHKGTFFVIGARAEAHADLLQEIARRGHGLGNHTYQHSYRTAFAPPSQLAAELRKTGALIQQLAGITTHWFRAPVGLLSPRVAAAARLAGVDVVAWTASARDGVASRRVPESLQKLGPHLVPGAILVLHDGVMDNRNETIALPLLREVLDRLDDRGLKSVTLDQLLAATPGTAEESQAAAPVTTR
jgi:peptidoglycan/xylan/chitin deacetylase (PgdA/CDA1 family)